MTKHDDVDVKYSIHEKTLDGSCRPAGRTSSNKDLHRYQTMWPRGGLVLRVKEFFANHLIPLKSKHCSRLPDRPTATNFIDILTRNVGTVSTAELVTWKSIREKPTLRYTARLNSLCLSHGLSEVVFVEKHLFNCTFVPLYLRRAKFFKSAVTKSDKRDF